MIIISTEGRRFNFALIEEYGLVPCETVFDEATGEPRRNEWALALYWRHGGDNRYRAPLTGRLSREAANTVIEYLDRNLVVGPKVIDMANLVEEELRDREDHDRECREIEEEQRRSDEEREERENWLRDTGVLERLKERELESL